MEKIYPEAPKVETAFSLTAEETLLLKKGIVLAIQKEIEHPQGRALDAVAFAKLSSEREQAVRNHLSVVEGLEPSVCDEGREIKARLRAAYDKGITDAVALIPVVGSKIVDDVLCAKRFVEAETHVPLTPVFVKEVPPPPIEEPIEPIGGEEINKP